MAKILWNFVSKILFNIIFRLLFKHERDWVFNHDFVIVIVFQSKGLRYWKFWFRYRYRFVIDIDHEIPIPKFSVSLNFWPKSRKNSGFRKEFRDHADPYYGWTIVCSPIPWTCFLCFSTSKDYIRVLGIISVKNYHVKITLTLQLLKSIFKDLLK